MNSAMFKWQTEMILGRSCIQKNVNIHVDFFKKMSKNLITNKLEYKALSRSYYIAILFREKLWLFQIS